MENAAAAASKLVGEGADALKYLSEAGVRAAMDSFMVQPDDVRDLDNDVPHSLLRLICFFLTAHVLFEDLCTLPPLPPPSSTPSPPQKKKK